MARSRVGGSKGLLSGKVGDVIYSITRNADGSFRQGIGAYPESRFNPNTDAQACARMAMGMIERAMFTYRDFMGTGFENVDLGTNSVSKFSEVNYNEIREEILAYWDMPDWTEWNYDFPKKGQTVPKDGEFIISQGSIRWDGLVYCVPATANRRYFEVECLGRGVQPTVRHWLDSHNLKAGMQFVGIFFCEGTTPSRSFVAWIMLWTDENVRLDDVITASNWRNYIKTNSNVPLNSYFSDTDGSLHLRCERLDDLQVSRTGCTGRRVRMRDGAKFRYNNCQMQWVVSPSPQEAWGWKTLWQVKDTWIGLPIPPTPTHRIPLEYQEVLYITSIDDVRITTPINYSAHEMTLEFAVIFQYYRSAYIFSQISSLGCLTFNTRNKAKSKVLILRSKDAGGTVETTLKNIFDLNTVYQFKVWTENDQIVVELNGDVSRYTNNGVTYSYSRDSFDIFASQNYYARCSIYEVIIRNTANRSILHDLVPCYRKNDSAIGFYDINDKTFYTVDDSQSKMTYGPVVNPT